VNRYSKLLTKRAKNWTIYWLVKLLIRFLSATSRQFSLWFCGLLGGMAYFILGKQRRKTLLGLRLMGGIKPKELKRIARGVFYNLGRNAADTFRMVGPGDFGRGLIKVKGWEKFQETYSWGRGLVGLTAHLGNWELIGAWLSWKGYPLTVVGRELYDPRLDKLLVGYRKGVGERNVSISQGAKPLLLALKRGEMIGLLADRGGKGVGRMAFPLFGKLAFIPMGPFLLAQRAGSPLLPLFIHLTDDGHHLLEVGEPIDPQGDLKAIVGRWVEILEGFVRRYPTHLAWMGVNWVEG